jgi:hypothetical protein
MHSSLTEYSKSVNGQKVLLSHDGKCFKAKTILVIKINHMFWVNVHQGMHSSLTEYNKRVNGQKVLLSHDGKCFKAKTIWLLDIPNVLGKCALRYAQLINRI